jgi:drug/metabolite transporter, DME family
MTPGASNGPACQGRVMILAAAVLWSTSGAFTRFLDEPTALGLDEPRLDPLQIAAGRVLFAALVLAPLLRRRDVSFAPTTALTAISFALMNVTFILAMALGTAANAILLQYTAPLWLFLAGVLVLGERADRRGTVALAIGLAGIAVILLGGWQGEQVGVIALGLVSGLFFAGVLYGLRLQRDASPVWLTVVNHSFAGLVLLPFLWHHPLPTLPQLGWLALFGALQMGVPYVLMARGLRTVGPQEAGTLSLLEPMLNPVWAYLVSPERERPTVYVLLGGTCILGALAYRYWPGQPSPLAPVRQ